jgi:fibronectin type 3 domain-containing protein
MFSARRSRRPIACPRTAHFRFDARFGPVEKLEQRLLLAAHIVGDPTVYSTIQAAVNAAAPGATINVDSGFYSELVTVNKPLTLRGARAGIDARSNVRQGFAGETMMPGAPVADGNTSAFYITASDVTIDGFFCSGNTSISQYGAGIVIAPGVSGTHILDNVLEGNISGLFLANSSPTDPAVIQYNAFLYNNNLGSLGGRGIYSDGNISGGVLTNVVIDSNFFLNNHGDWRTTTALEAAISLESYSSQPDAQSNIRITNNTFDENGKALLAWNASNLLFEGNVVTSTLDSGSGTIRLEGGVSNVTITGNNLYDNVAPALRVDSKAFGADNSGVVMTGNDIYGNGYDLHDGAVDVDSSTYDGALDASNNWWGDASGPSGDFSGSGDAVFANGANVGVSPWAVAPVVGEESAFMGLPTIPGPTIQAENFDQGGPGVGYNIPGSLNKWSNYRATTATFEFTSDNGGGYDVKGLAAGQWLTYTIDVPQAGSFRIDFRAASGQTTGGTFNATIDNTDVTGPLVLATGGDQTWATISSGSFSLAAGQHVLKLLMDNDGSGGVVGNFNWLDLVPVAAPPPALPTAPSGLNANAVSSSQINLSWTDTAANQTGVEVDRSIDGTNFTPLINVGATATGYSDSGLAAGTKYYYRVEATGASGNSPGSNVASATTVANSVVTTYLSDLTWTSATVGWGTIHKDASIGGNPIRIRGTTYARGIGTHAVSVITYNLGGQFQSFLSDVGLDDETFGQGFVSFKVLGDGKTLFDSGVLTGTSPVVHVNISVAGVQQLQLLAINGIATNWNWDHADWAGARLTSASAVPIVPSAPSGLSATATSSSQIRLNWTNTASNQTGFEIDRSPDGVNFSPATTVGASTTTWTDSGLNPSTKYYYRVEAINAVGASPGSNVANATTLPVSSTTTYLSDLNWTSATVGWGTIHKDASVGGNPIRIRGTTYARGIGTHAISQITYELGGQFQSFISDVGVDDETFGQGFVEFKVVGDGKVLFDSGVLGGNSPVVHVNVSVAGVQQLQLLAINGIAANWNSDHADWAGARLTS